MGADDRDERDDREAILARRALLVAAALAGLGLGAEGCNPFRPCLSPAHVERDAGPPRPCLTPAPGTWGPPADAAVAPRPCLSEVREPPPGPPPGAPDAASPAPCLSIPPPEVCLRVSRPPTRR